MKLNKVYKLYIESSINKEEVLVITNPITIKFNIERKVFAGANTLNISIYNLGKETRDLIFKDAYDTNIENRRSIILEAGYDAQNLSTIFLGTVMSAYTMREGSNIVTKVYALDGALETQTAYTHQTFMDSTLPSLINNLASSISGLSVGAINVQDEKFTRPIVLSGNTYNIIQKYTDGQAFVDLGKIYVMGNEDVIEGYVPMINAKSGLLGTPERRNTNLSVKMIFEPRIIVGQVIQIDSIVDPRFDGQYKVIGLSHQGTISDSSNSNCITELQLWVGAQIFGGFNVIKKTY